MPPKDTAPKFTDDLVRAVLEHPRFRAAVYASMAHKSRPIKFDELALNDNGKPL